MTSGTEELEQAITTFLAENDEGVISRSRVVNPLLDIWKLASDIDPSVARPLEGLLTALAYRQIVTAAELDETLAGLRDALHKHCELVTV